MLTRVLGILWGGRAADAVTERESMRYLQNLSELCP